MHQAVLLTESIAALITDPHGCYIDATFGRGGHSRAILERLQAPGKLIVIDKDPEAIAVARDLQAQGLPIIPVHGSFAEIKRIATELDLQGQIQGVLFDLGVSSPQLDNAARGFSFMREGPLDMRMDPTKGLSAADFLAYVKEDTLTEIIKTYGEERFAKFIARAICKARLTTKIETSTQLAQIIKDAMPRVEKHKHPATRTFQAIRIYINQELDDLTLGLQAAFETLNRGGRLVVISFHSLEDRIVKQWMRKLAKGVTVPAYIPIRAEENKSPLKILPKCTPSAAECAQNNRARSAMMRVAEKI